MSTAAPKTPEQPARKVAINRSFSAASASNSNRAQPTAEIGATEGVETLFTHASGKIIKFTSNAPTRSSSSGTWSPGGSQQKQGTLPWATLTEKTMAAGPLEIYRVPGSVSFLHSGSLLHAIMPRSNCWCVDGVSKFAMRVLPDTYYRIELPGDTPENLAKVEEFKTTLQKVLFYERTACPFARTFEVDLPAEGEPKPRKRRRRTDGPAKKWKLDRAYSWKPEGWTPEQGGPSDGSSGSATASEDEEGSSGSPEELADELTYRVGELNVNTPPAARKPTVKDRAKGINMRSVTAPPQSQLQPTPSSKLRTSFLPEANAHGETTSLSSSKEARMQESSPGVTREERQSENVHPIKPLQFSPRQARESETVSGASRREHFSKATPIDVSGPGDPDIEAAKLSHLLQEVTESDNAQEYRSFQPMPTDMPPSPPDSNVGFDFALASSAPSRPMHLHENSLHQPQYVAHSSASDDGITTPVISEKSTEAAVQGPVAVVEQAAANSDQLETFLNELHTNQTDVSSTLSEPQAMLENVEDHTQSVTRDTRHAHLLGNSQVSCQAPTESNHNASLPEINAGSDTPLHNLKDHLSEPSIHNSGSMFEVDGTTEVYIEHPSDDIYKPAVDAEPQPDASGYAHLTRVTSSEADPFAAIQAMIQARRSIGGNTTQGFVPIQRQTTRLSSTSTASSNSLRSQRRSQVISEKDQSAVATALVRKAASAFLGPPVHLVAIMLKIAARFAKGAFPRALLFESPAGMVKRVPGSFDLDDSDIEEEFSSEEELDDEEEDDFGVPLRSPISRLASGESVSRMIADSGLKERKVYEVER